MAWYSEKSVFSYGKYKGKKVSEVDDANYIDWLHHSNLNVYFKPEVLDRLKIVNKGKNKDRPALPISKDNEENNTSPKVCLYLKPKI
jgi:hypothetical protein